MGKRKLGNRYELGRTLGVGAFGKVKCATNVKTGEQVAIKILNRADIKKHGLINSVRTEVTALQLIPPHKHIVNLIEVLESKLTLYLVLELVSGGELFDKIKLEGKLNEDVARHYFRQLISALEFMHEKKICHRDLKLENLLVDQDGVLKVTDFGLSGLHTGGDEVFKTTLGSPNYVAPEVLIGKGYDGFKADIWSSGVILYVLLAGFLPFDEDNANELFKKICTGDFRYPQTFSNGVIDLLNHILVVDPAKRYALAHIKRHAWFQSNKAEDKYFDPDEVEHEDGLMISAHPNKPTQIETPRMSPNNKQSISWRDEQEQEHEMISVTPSFGTFHSADSYQPAARHRARDSGDSEPFEEDEKQGHVRKSRSQRSSLAIRAGAGSGSGHEKRSSLQIRLEKYDPEADKDGAPRYDDVMQKYGDGQAASASGTHSKTPSASVDASELSISDYLTSDMDSGSNPSGSPRHAMEPISMTAFDLIGIVSTQMLNNVFTRSLSDTSAQIKTFTRFVCSSTPPKILYAIQEAVHRIADCTCRVASDRYEIKVVKRKGHRTIHINIQIFQTPLPSEYMIECRRTQGNIFKYHEFFEEFQKQYNNVIAHLHKAPAAAKKKKPQIKFRKSPQAQHANAHSRSVSANAVMTSSATTGAAKHAHSATNTAHTAHEITDNLHALQELSASQSQPVGDNGSNANMSDVVGQLRSLGHKSTASSGSSIGAVPSHHSSVSERSSVSEQKENLNSGSSASPTPTPTHQHNSSNHSNATGSESLTEEEDEDSSVVDESEANKDKDSEQLKVRAKGHRRSSSGKTYGVTSTGHLDIPAKVPEASK